MDEAALPSSATDEALDNLVAFGEAAEAVLLKRIDDLRIIILNEFLSPEEQLQMICKKVKTCIDLDNVTDTMRELPRIVMT